MPAQLIHVIVDVAPNHTDLTAWVSAGAAVVQAVAAGLAIWYSGKLARDAAEREKKADAAANRRIVEAASAAAKQRQSDTEWAEHQREIGRVERHNLPIDQMLNFAEMAAKDLILFRVKLETSTAKEAEMQWPDQVRGQALFKQRGLSFIEQAPDGLTATRMRHLYDTFDVLAPVGMPAAEWLGPVRDKELAIETAMDELRVCRLTPPAPPSPPPAEP